MEYLRADTGDGGNVWSTNMAESLVELGDPGEVAQNWLGVGGVEGERRP